MFTLKVKSEVEKGLSGIIRSLTAGLAKKHDINVAAGRAAAQLTKKHLYGLAQSRHRAHVGLNFYEDAADATKHKDVGDAAEVRIDKAGIAQRFYGGRIEAVKYSHLWIPLKGTAAEGRASGEFQDLVPIISPLTGKGVALKDGKPLFALVKSVNQKSDDTVLPKENEYEEVTSEAVSLLVDRLLEKNIETRGFAR